MHKIQSLAITLSGNYNTGTTQRIHIILYFRTKKDYIVQLYSNFIR